MGVQSCHRPILVGALYFVAGCSSDPFYCDRALSCDDARAPEGVADAAADASSTAAVGTIDATPTDSPETSTLPDTQDEDAAAETSLDAGPTVDEAMLDAAVEDASPATEAEDVSALDASPRADAEPPLDSSEPTDESDTTPDAGVPVEASTIDDEAVCGDGLLQTPEVCDHGGSSATELGACNPECSGYYEKKYIRATSDMFSGALGGPAGADAVCVSEFGDGWKALLTGGDRRATVTPNLGDAALDWVLQPYTHYYNWDDALIWRTDETPLLGVRDGSRQNLYAPLFDDELGYHPWSGFRPDWTTVEDDEAQSVGNCLGWTDEGTAFGTFATPDLSDDFNDYCGSLWGLLCVEQ